MSSEWRELISRANIPLDVCSASIAELQDEVDPLIRISGMASFIESIAESDRLVTL